MGKIVYMLSIVLLVIMTMVACNSRKEKLDKSQHEINASKENLDYAPGNTILGKTLCGYQGWFNAQGDGFNLGWKHFRVGNRFEPGFCSIDYWPDLTGFEDDEIYKTSFKENNGSVAGVFSSVNPKTVNRHFNWMGQFDIDGAFIQRFVTNVRSEDLHTNMNKVFDNCFNSADSNDRLISVMYDFTGSNQDVVGNTIKDWKMLVDKYQINSTSNKNVLTYLNKPVVALWGVGFKDRNYTLKNVLDLIHFFKKDPKYGNCSVLLGVPTGWRTLDGDCISDARLHDIIKSGDILQPWTPGRYSTLKEVDGYRVEYMQKDKEWCDDNNLLYMPVVFPGFSWHNLKKGFGQKAELNAIPRLKGQFLWQQFNNAIAENVESIYVAMFDEMDEGTCIFKVSQNPPSAESPFLNYEGLPSDYYLWLTGQAAKMLRKEIPLSNTIPHYKNDYVE